jgi:hypothetical protein
MNINHTPGPWTVGLYSFDNVQGAHGIFPKDCRIPICHSIMGGDLEEADANARLIAAAPELLVALRALLQDAIELGIYEGNMNGSAVAARNAIDKATNSFNDRR